MEQTKEQKQKSILFWIYISVIAVLVIGVVVIAIMFANALQNQPVPTETEPPVTQPITEPTAESTEAPPPSLPDIPMNQYGAEDFQYEGEYLTCVSGESVLGIDVSSYQGDINWEAVKDAGFEFVMIRVAGRGYGEAGVLYDDDNAQKNYQGAIDAGLKVGAYFFAQAITVEEAEEEAAYILEKTKNWQLDMPIVYDWECEGPEYRTYGLDPRTLTDCTQAFCRAVKAAGHDAMIYFNPDAHNKQFYIEELTGYGFWLAMYSDQMTYPYHFDMWQYTKDGTVPGISGSVDINLYFPM